MHTYVARAKPDYAIHNQHVGRIVHFNNISSLCMSRVTFSMISSGTS